MSFELDFKPHGTSTGWQAPGAAQGSAPRSLSRGHLVEQRQSVFEADAPGGAAFCAGLRCPVYSLEASIPIDLAAALERSKGQALDAIFIVEDPLTFGAREQIVAFANSTRLPAIYGLREFVEVVGSFPMAQI